MFLGMNSKKNSKKAISPLIAAVLLIAFTMAIAGILVSWMTGFTKTETNYVGDKADNQIVCTYAGLDAKKNDVSYNFSGSSSTVNVSVLNSGDQALYNFTFLVKTNSNIYTFVPTNQYNKTNPFNSGVGTLLLGVNQSSAPSSSETIKELKIRALCKDDYAITHKIIMS